MGDSSGLNPFNTSPEHQKTNNQSIPSHISPHFQNFPPQFSHPFQHQFPRNFNPYSMPPYHPYGGYPPRMPYDSSFNLSPGGVFGRGVINEGALSSSPVESMAFGRGVGALGTASPISPEPQINDEVQELSDNSDVEENRGGRMNWTEDENRKLVSAWLNNSTNSAMGTSQKGIEFWKKLVAEFNSNIAPDRRRTVAQCKTHYTKTNRLIVKFNGCWIRMKRAHGSGESDDQVMEKAHAIYRGESEGKAFTLDYWWKIVKDQPKWANRAENQELYTNKRAKQNASGAYTSSSNQETEDTEATRRTRPGLGGYGYNWI